jgi:amino acid transporter
LFGGLFFVVVTAIEMMAFGTNDAGVDAFKNSDAVMGDIAARYVGGWVSDAIVIGATVSSVACCLASVVGASRLVYALSRDGLGPSWLAPVDPQRRVPRRAATACVLVTASIQLVSWLVLQAKPYDVFTISGTAGTLVLLVAYGLATLGVIRLFMSRERTDLHRWEVLIAIAGVTLLAYTLYSNVVPLPTGTALWGPVRGASCSRCAGRNKTARHQN